MVESKENSGLKSKLHFRLALSAKLNGSRLTFLSHDYNPGGELVDKCKKLPRLHRQQEPECIKQLISDPVVIMSGLPSIFSIHESIL